MRRTSSPVDPVWIGKVAMRATLRLPPIGRTGSPRGGCATAKSVVLQPRAGRWCGVGRTASLTPLRHVIDALQGPWLGAGWNWPQLALVAAMGLAAWFLAVRFLRWE